MSAIYLLSTLLMGLLLVAVVVAIGRTGQRATPSGTAGDRSGFAEWSGRTSGETSRIAEVASDPLAWTVSFVLLAFVFLGGSVLVVTGIAIPAAVETGLLAIGGAVLLGYVFFGAYFAVLDRSGQTAAAVGVGAALVGTLMLVGIVVALVTG